MRKFPGALQSCHTSEAGSPNLSAERCCCRRSRGRITLVEHPPVLPQTNAHMLSSLVLRGPADYGKTQTGETKQSPIPLCIVSPHLESFKLAPFQIFTTWSLPAAWHFTSLDLTQLINSTAFSPAVLQKVLLHSTNLQTERVKKEVTDMDLSHSIPRGNAINIIPFPKLNQINFVFRKNILEVHLLISH